MSFIASDNIPTDTTVFTLDNFYPPIHLQDFYKFEKINFNIDVEIVKNTIKLSILTINRQLNSLKNQHDQITAAINEVLISPENIEDMYTNAVFKLTKANIYEHNISTVTTKDGANKNQQMATSITQMMSQYRDSIANILNQSTIEVELL